MDAASHIMAYEQMYQVAIIALLVFVLLAIYHHREKFSPMAIVDNIKNMIKPERFAPMNIIDGIKGLIKGDVNDKSQSDSLVPGYHGNYDPSVLNLKPLSLAQGDFGVPAKEGYMCPKYNSSYSWPHTWTG